MSLLSESPLSPTSPLKGKELMKQLGSLSIVPAEIKWYHDSLPMNYGIILDIRNESAVAALALHGMGGL